MTRMAAVSQGECYFGRFGGSKTYVISVALFIGNYLPWLNHSYLPPLAPPRLPIMRWEKYLNPRK